MVKKIHICVHIELEEMESNLAWFQIDDRKKKTANNTKNSPMVVNIAVGIFVFGELNDISSCVKKNSLLIFTLRTCTLNG